MAVACNVTDTFGATTPTGGYTNESSQDGTVEKFSVLDEDGVKKKLRVGKHTVLDVQISGKGGADYSVIAAGDFTEDAFKALSAETTEYNTGEYIDFAITGKIHGDTAA